MTERASRGSARFSLLVRRAAVGAAALAALAACGGQGDALTEPGVQHGPYPVVRVVDGDTIRVDRDGEEIVVRFIGINTPETVAPNRPIECFGPEASARTKELLAGANVWLEYDEVSGLTDKYDRTLAYVWTSPDTMLNEQLVREGYAEEYTYSDGFRWQQVLEQAERDARERNVGLWAAC